MKEEKGIKYGENKPMWGLLPFVELEEVVNVLTDAIKTGKYPKNNWMKVEGAREKYFDSLMRHCVEWKLGAVRDKDSNRHPMAHVICNALFLMWHDKHSKEK